MGARATLVRHAARAGHVALALVVGYLDILALAAFAWRGPRERRRPAHSFALLIPAYNEEGTLPRALASIAALDYPRGLVDVHVVADNCTDGTADVAWLHGATVHRRTDPLLRGKGHALGWLIDQLSGQLSGRRYDAYVVVDADTVVSPNLLRVFDAHLARGDEAIQSYYGTEPGESWSARLRELAFALYNGVRPRGRDALGFSVGLHGNGMCFTADLLRHVGWNVAGLAEDAEFHLRLVEAGARVRYAGDASVTALMPLASEGAETQHVRWERGRLRLLGSVGPRLLADGLRYRDPVRLEAIAQQMIPPFSLITALVAVNTLLSMVRSARGRRLSWMVAVGHVLYVALGLHLTNAPRATYVALARVPCYAAWKLWIYARAVGGAWGPGRSTEWVRTARELDGVSADGRNARGVDNKTAWT